MPAALRSFGARNKLELMDHRRGPDRTEIYRLSCTNREQRPQFLTIEVRADYLRCGHVVFTAEELLRDRVPVSGLAGHGRGCFLADQGGQHDAQAQTTRALRHDREADDVRSRLLAGLLVANSAEARHSQ